jgi:hypothetical protein
MNPVKTPNQLWCEHFNVPLWSWNSRFLAYCCYHGSHDPEEMLERDRALHPGGVMVGFILWSNERWDTLRAKHGWTRDGENLREQQHAANLDLLTILNDCIAKRSFSSPQAGSSSAGPQPGCSEDLKGSNA